MPKRIGQAFMFFLFALALFAANIASPFAQAQTQSVSALGQATIGLGEKLAAIEKIINEERKELGVPGVSLVIVKDDRVIYLRGLGVRDVERGLPVTADTLFAIASCTKAFTAMATMMSVDEGKLSLEDSPKKFLTYFKLLDAEADGKITIRDMLSHRSGLSATDELWHAGVLSREEVIRALAFAKPTARLGEKYQYQNVMFSAAGESLAKAQHSTWERVVREHIFRPLGMKATNTSIQEMQKTRDFSLGYEYITATKEQRRIPMGDLKGIASTAPAGAINSNAREMGAWVRLMLGEGVFEGKRLVSEKSFKELVSEQIAIEGNSGYGLGWVLEDWNGHKVIQHDGGVPGFSSRVALMPDQKLGFVMLTNASFSPLHLNVTEAIWSNLAGSSQSGGASTGAAVTAASIANSQADLEREVGTYRLAEAELDVEISLKDGKLRLTLPNQIVSTLENVGGRRYRLTVASGGEFVTFRADSGDPTKTEVYVERPQGNFVLRRMPDFNAPLTVDDLMSKVIAARGGETSLRRHKSMVQTIDVHFENQGMTGSGTISTRAPNAAATEYTLTSLGKQIATYRDFFDGTMGGTETSFSSAIETKSGTQLDDARLANDFYQTIDWKKLFKDVVIKRIEKVNDEDVYVIVKTPEKGNSITEYVSTKSFLVLQRDLLVASNTDGGYYPQTETYSDYRAVDRVVLPFKTAFYNDDLGSVILQLKDVKFDVEIPDSVFRARAKIAKRK